MHLCVTKKEDQSEDKRQDDKIQTTLYACVCVCIMQLWGREGWGDLLCSRC